MDANSEIILQVTDLHKSFGNLKVLKGVDLSLKRSELVFILGPSGSGKSTFLRCCNRLEEANSGTIIFNNINIIDAGADINKYRRQIGMVFQSFNLYPHLSVERNVMLALRKVLGLSKADAHHIALKQLDRVGLLDKAESFPAQLSGGQQQRVAIARALALDPQIMLFDEPTSALDPELVGDVLNVMKDLKDNGMTMLVVSHEMSFVRAAADRIIFMEDGYIVEQGPPEKLFENPEHQRTRDFLHQIEH